MNEKLNFTYSSFPQAVPPSFSDYDIDSEEGKVGSFFDETEDAIFTLYQELFNSGDGIDSELIYKAVKYLLWKKGMVTQYEEMDGLTEDDICVRHYSYVNKAVEDRLSYFKTIVTQTVEDYV